MKFEKHYVIRADMKNGESVIKYMDKVESVIEWLKDNFREIEDIVEIWDEEHGLEVTGQFSKYWMESKCQSCGDIYVTVDLRWVYDRYGIPYKKVCDNCIKQTERDAKGFEFDPMAAGENLEPEDY